ncbi:hypothetical protein MAPG_02242 [Magnaporthiopsis poae ATCC 64411]|uniref:Uncharacterized protein n=1 Tax=Magnaporthiopsis poae (strain ATCC 64411 / 73-15) TaxID=644358 RepID=A0A0C4DQU5_MAGP6|nr:hypothetical protein MAPG_02242 [Magnaporthiopsis poae ATCC 64411]
MAPFDGSHQSDFKTRQADPPRKSENMPPFDYSKWDNIGDDSDDEGSSAPAALPYVPSHKEITAAAIAAASASIIPEIASGPVQAVIIRCRGERIDNQPWYITTIAEDHPVFSVPVLPVSALIEFPLVLRRIGTKFLGTEETQARENQIATYLNINATTVGNVIVARVDRKPLFLQHLEAVWMYCDRILYRFGDGDGAPTALYNRKAFTEWWNEYCAKQKKSRKGTGGEQDPDDWRAVKSPYEV